MTNSWDLTLRITYIRQEIRAIDENLQWKLPAHVKLELAEMKKEKEAEISRLRTLVEEQDRATEAARLRTLVEEQKSALAMRPVRLEELP